MKNLTVLFLVLILFSCNTSENSSDAVNDLPAMTVRLTDGTFHQMNTLNGKTILVLFQPGCDHCQIEAVEISKNLESFKSYQVYFISSASVSNNQQFAANYGLAGASNFHFGSTTADHVVQNFGSIPTPSLYVYSENGELLTEFIGQTPIEEIIAAL
jgi:peroxiredoxin